MAYRNLIGADNFFETASKEELIDFLIKKINSEVEKGDGADCDLIRECSDWLDELTQDEIVFTPDELERNLEKIKAKVMSDKPIKKRKQMSVKTFMRVALIAAVIFTISILSLSVVASNDGYDSIWEYFSKGAEKLLGMNRGEKISENGINVIKNTGIVTYDNMDEFVTAESLDILYPDVLPNGIKIIELRFIHKNANNYTLCITFSNSLYVFNISNSYSINTSTLNEFGSVVKDNINCYITKKEDDMYYAVFQHNGFEYTVQAPTYDDLLEIIMNMKG